MVDDPADPKPRRSVGQAVTESTRPADGGVEMTSQVVVRLGRAAHGARRWPVEPGATIEIEFDSTYQIDPSGNLRSFHAEVRLARPIRRSCSRIDGQAQGRTPWRSSRRGRCRS